MAPNDATPAPRVGSPLPRGWRFVSGIAALCGLGAGGVAVFETDNEVGSTALLAVGLFFTIVAMLGRVPRIKLGDNEIDPTEAYVAGARDGADLVADATAQAALETNDVKKVAEAARAAETLAGALSAYRLRLTRYKDASGEAHVRITAPNGQVVGHLEDWPGLWTSPPTPPPPADN